MRGCFTFSLVVDCLSGASDQLARRHQRVSPLIGSVACRSSVALGPSPMAVLQGTSADGRSAARLCENARGERQDVGATSQIALQSPIGLTARSQAPPKTCSLDVFTQPPAIAAGDRAAGEVTLTAIKRSPRRPNPEGATVRYARLCGQRARATQATALHRPERAIRARCSHLAT